MTTLQTSLVYFLDVRAQRSVVDLHDPLTRASAFRLHDRQTRDWLQRCEGLLRVTLRWTRSHDVEERVFTFIHEWLCVRLTAFTLYGVEWSSKPSPRLVTDIQIFSTLFMASTSSEKLSTPEKRQNPTRNLLLYFFIFVSGVRVTICLLSRMKVPDSKAELLRCVALATCEDHARSLMEG